MSTYFPPSSRSNKRSVTKAPLVGAAFTLAVVLAGCSTASSDTATQEEAETQEITVSGPPSLNGLSLNAAIDGGQFEEHGLSVTPATNVSANDAVPNLMNDTQQVVVVDTVTFLQARSQGMPVQIVAGNAVQATNGGPDEVGPTNMVVRSDSGLESAEDLVDRTVAVPGLRTQMWMNIRAAVDEAGADSSQINFIEASGPQMIDLLHQNDADAVTATEPIVSSSTASGELEIMMSADAPGNQGVPSSVYIATEEFIAENPGVIEGFSAAVHSASAGVNGDRDYALQIAEEYLEFDPDTLQDAYIMDFSENQVEVEDVQKIIDLAVEYEILDEQLDAQGLLANP